MHALVEVNKFVQRDMDASALGWARPRWMMIILQRLSWMHSVKIDLRVFVLMGVILKQIRPKFHAT